MYHLCACVLVVVHDDDTIPTSTGQWSPVTTTDFLWLSVTVSFHQFRSTWVSTVLSNVGRFYLSLFSVGQFRSSSTSFGQFLL